MYTADKKKPDACDLMKHLLIVVGKNAQQHEEYTAMLAASVLYRSLCCRSSDASLTPAGWVASSGCRFGAIFRFFFLPSQAPSARL